MAVARRQEASPATPTALLAADQTTLGQWLFFRIAQPFHLEPTVYLAIIVVGAGHDHCTRKLVVESQVSSMLTNPIADCSLMVAERDWCLTVVHS